jgi:hypothetical protein
VHNDVGHVRGSVADVILEAASEFVGVGQPHIGPGDDGHEHHESVVGMQQAQLPRRLTGALDHQPLDPLALGLVRRADLVACREWTLERLEMRLHVIDFRVRADRGLDPLGDFVRVAEGRVRIELEMQ